MATSFDENGKRLYGGILPFTFSWTEENIAAIVAYCEAPGRVWAYSNWRLFKSPDDLMTSIGFNPFYGKTKPEDEGRSGRYKGIWECAPQDEADLQALGKWLAATPTADEELDSVQRKECFHKFVVAARRILPRRVPAPEIEARMVEAGAKFLPVIAQRDLFHAMHDKGEVEALIDGLAWEGEMRNRVRPQHPIDLVRSVLYAPALAEADEEDAPPFEPGFYDHINRMHNVFDVDMFVGPMLPLLAELVAEGKTYDEALDLVEQAGVFEHLSLCWLQLGAESAEDIYDIYWRVIDRHESEGWVNSFTGELRVLSNFAYIPVVYEGITYPTSEHAFQAAKVVGDGAARRTIAALSTPREAKETGRKVKLREDWEEVKFEVMLNILRDKFSQRNPHARATLVATKNRKLVEGNTWHDNCWGDCHCAKCRDIPGRNLLGIALMQVRSEIENSASFG